MEPSRSTFELNPLISEKTEESIESSSSTVDKNTNGRTRTTMTRQFDSFTHSAGKAYRPLASTSISSSSPSFSSTRFNGSSSKRSATNNLLNYVKRTKSTNEKSVIDLIKSAEHKEKADEEKDDIDNTNNNDNDNTNNSNEIEEMDSDIPPNKNDDADDSDDDFVSATATSLDNNKNNNNTNNSIPKEKSSTLRNGLWNTINEYVSIQMLLSQLGKLTKTSCNNNNNNNNANNIDNEDTTINTLSSSLKQASLNTDDNEIATKALSRVINKNDFSKFEVLGQFNNGFIIGLLDNHDIFIIDQHAADEKYNFETLQKSTRIKGQQLIK